MRLIQMEALPPIPPLGSRGGPRCPTPSLAGRAVRALAGFGPVVGNGQGAPRGRGAGPLGSPRSVERGFGA